MKNIIVLGAQGSVVAALLAKLPQAVVEDGKKLLFKTDDFAEMPILKEPNDYKPVVKRGKGKVKKW